MKSLDYTLELLPGNQTEIPNLELPLTNPQPILQQTKSNITTNPFIIEQEKAINPTFTDINTGVSKSFIGFMDDLFNKPDNISWPNYLKIILAKDQRYTYLTVLLFFSVLYIYLIK